MTEKSGKTMKEATRAFRKKFIIRCVRKYNGNVSLTAKKLGITRNTLIININQLGIHKDIKELSRNREKMARKEIAIHLELNGKNLLQEATNRFQKKYMIKALKATKGNEAKAALLTDVHRNTVINKVEWLGLKSYLKSLRVERRKAKKQAK